MKALKYEALSCARWLCVQGARGCEELYVLGVQLRVLLRHDYAQGDAVDPPRAPRLPAHEPRANDVLPDPPGQPGPPNM